jgi:hypothetical protein
MEENKISNNKLEEAAVGQKPKHDVRPHVKHPPKVDRGYDGPVATVRGLKRPVKMLGLPNSLVSSSAPTPNEARAKIDGLTERYRRMGTRRHHIGKVNNSLSPARYLPAGAFMTAPIVEAVATAAPTVGYSPLTFGGGPLISDAELISVFWGTFTPAEITGMQAYLRGLAGYLSGDGAPQGSVPVLWQYNCVCAHIGATFTDPSTPQLPPGQQATDQNVRNEILSLQKAGNLPDFASNRIFIVFTKGINFQNYGIQPNGYCAYHNAIAEGQLRSCSSAHDRGCLLY